MSINVTVSGNPVCVKKGKMVTCGCGDPAKIDFDKRRLMRLEQVRQQSKDIAANVRHKLRKEKDKRLSEIEREGQEKLKNWQARKLLDLQNQYEDALDDYGMAHKQADIEEKEEEVVAVKKCIGRRVAKERGAAAMERVQIEKNTKRLKEAVPVQRKKMSRDLENTRSSLVSSVNKIKREKSPLKKRIKQKHVPDSTTMFDSDGENRIPKLKMTGDDESALSSSGSECESVCALGDEAKKFEKEQQTSAKFDGSPRDRSAQTDNRQEAVTSTAGDSQLPYDNRISERIKRRYIPSRRFCECNSDERPQGDDEPLRVNTQTQTSLICDCCKCPVKYPEGDTDSCTKPCAKGKSTPTKEQFRKERDRLHHIDESFRKRDDCQEDEDCELSAEEVKSERSPRRSRNAARHSRAEKSPARPRTVPKKKVDTLSDSRSTKSGIKSAPVKKSLPLNSTGEIPFKPKVTLRSVKGRQPDLTQLDTSAVPSERVRQYDHPNRFTSYSRPTTHIERIPDEDILLSSGDSEHDFREKMKQRDMEAHVRGQKAMEKERIYRDYREMMKKLPLLQKQERIGEINKDKPQYHMSKERLEEFEKKRQNRLDNAYEKLFVDNRPPMVTLPKRKESPPALNMLQWNEDFEKTLELDRTQALSEMLANLTAQKKELLKEIDCDLECKAKKVSNQKRKRGRISPEVAIEPESKSSSSSKEKMHGISPKKRRKIKRKILILQNTSTQTTPKVELVKDQERSTSPKSLQPTYPKWSEATTCKEAKDVATSPKTPQQLNVTSPSEKNKPTDLSVNNQQVPSPQKKKVDSVTEQSVVVLQDEKVFVCTEPHIPCDCKNKEFEIVIKITEDKPEVEVRPASSNVQVVTEESLEKDKALKERTLFYDLNEGREHSRVTDISAKESDAESIASKKRHSPKKCSSKNKSWREQLNDTSKSTTSTSYLSPPDGTVSQTDPNTPNNTAGTSYASPLDVDETKGTVYLSPPNGGRQKPIKMTASKGLRETSADTNVSIQSKDGKDLDPRLVVYIQKLLDMSRNQLDRLSVSSSSEVSTPSQSVVDIPSNNPLSQLKNVIKYFNINPADVRRHVTTKSDDGEFQSTNTSANTTECSSKSGPDELLKLKQYVEITESCTKKINDINEKIEKVRAEKRKILQTTPKEAQFPKESEIDEIDRLLDIDYNFAEKLKTMSPQEIQEKKKEELEKMTPMLIEKDFSNQNSDEELMNRLKRLLEPSNANQAPSPLDVQRLPRLETTSVSNDGLSNGNKKKPPPSKGLKLLNRVGGPQNIHELSTIIEGESQVSTKIESPKRNVVAVQDGQQDAIPEVPPGSTSGDEKTDPLEHMLRNIGMEWAIPTLKKTREALALSSSSSSGDSKLSSKSDVSLKDFLDRDRFRQASTPKNTEGRNAPVVFLEESDISSVRENSNTNKLNSKESATQNIEEGNVAFAEQTPLFDDAKIDPKKNDSKVKTKKRGQFGKNDSKENNKSEKK